MRKGIAYAIILALLLTMAGCGSGNGSKETENQTGQTAAQTEKQTDKETNAQAQTEGETKEAAGDTGEYTLPKGDYVIGLSNSYYGNTWRKQMVDSFEAAATEAKEKGYISDFIVQNGDGSVNAQIAQINSFILEGVDAICINAASPTALNSVIDKATQAGIKVIAFDSVVTNESAYKMDYDFVKFGTDCGAFIADKLGGTGNIVMVRGVSGTAPDENMFKGFEMVLGDHPDLNVVATVVGEASATVAQEEFTKILPSLDKVDATFNQGGDSYGIAQAFEQAGIEPPIIVGDNSAEFIQWWIEQKEKNGYETISMRAAPSCGSAALWTAINILNGEDVPMEMILNLVTITNDNVDDYADLEAGTIAAPLFTNDIVMNEIIIPARESAK